MSSADERYLEACRPTSQSSKWKTEKTQSVQKPVENKNKTKNVDATRRRRG